MAGRKLSNDEIKWILSVDAHGAQAEVKKFSSEINRLKKENDALDEAIKDTNKTIKEQEKALKLLEKQGKQSSKEYKRLEMVIKDAKQGVVEMTKGISENSKSIDEQNKNINEFIKTMDLQDMTMSQLRKRAADLQKQMEHTSASLSPDAYKKLQKELGDVNDRMFVVQNTGKSMIGTFAAMNNPVGSAARAVQGFNQVLNFLRANPIIAVITILVGLFVKLRDVVMKNEQAVRTLTRIFEPFSQMIDTVINLIMSLVNWLLKFVETALESFRKLLEKLPFVGNKIKEINERTAEMNRLQREANEVQLKNIESIAEKELEIAKLKEKTYRKDIYNAEERIGFMKEMEDLQLSILDDKMQEKQLEIDMLQLVDQRIKDTRAWQTENAQANADLLRLQKEYFEGAAARERRLNGFRNELRNEEKEAQRQAADEAKRAIEDRLKNEDLALTQQINNLKQARLEETITEQEYNRQVEQLTLETANRKLQIKGQEKDKILQLEKEILDTQIKMKAEEEKAMKAADESILEAIRKEKENQLQLLDSARNTKLEILQEEESDQQIYALRAAELEAETAEARLQVIRQFSETLRQTEFNNAGIRLEAIEANEKDIIAAEKKTLSEQEKLRRQFGKSIADIERQYNIKNWEQRKEDELRILEKQRDEKLMSEETYQAAIAAIERKYRDEVYRAQQQAAVDNMKQQFSLELEGLKLLHEQKLLSIEEYEEAVFRMRMRYYSRYAQMAADYIQQVAGVVSEMMAAETTNIEARYDAEIAAAGNNKDEVERLEREKAKKKLEIEKKYADVQFAITAAQIIASTAMAVMQAFAQLGPIAGAIAGALVAAAGIAQLLVANAQRKKVKAMTLADGGSSDAPPSGKITMREGFAEGGHNIDYSSGGHTAPGPKYAQTGWLPVHGGEYVVASDEMARPDVAGKVRYIENIRRNRLAGRRAYADGFAEGGPNKSARTEKSIADEKKTFENLTKVVQRLVDGDITVNYGITEMEAQQRRRLEVENLFTKQL